MKLKLPFLFASLAVTLAGCFTSSEPLLIASTSGFPFPSLGYTTDDGGAGTITRDGDHYVLSALPGAAVLFKPFGPFFFVQLTQSDAADTPPIAYAVATIATATGTISLYRLTQHDGDVGTGPGQLPACAGDAANACITDPQQLVDLVRAAIDAGEAPDMVLHLSP